LEVILSSSNSGNSASEKGDLSRKGGGAGALKPILYFVLFIGSCLFVLYVVAANLLGNKEKELSSLVYSSQLIEMENSRDFYANWLSDKLGEGAASTLDWVATLLISSAQLVPASDDFVSKTWIALHIGLIRVAFMLVAWWKFWIVAVAAAIIWSMQSWKIYRANDLLGRQTNGRLFYSGIRGEVKKVDASGAPDLQVPGLACPKTSTPAEVKVSALGKVLEAHKVANITNSSLAGIILAYKEWPAFVAARNEVGLLEKAYQKTELAKHAALVLEAALSLQETYLKYIDRISELTLDDEQAAHTGPISAEQYAQKLKFALNRVLTPALKIAMTQLSAKELATIVLAEEAGKVMAYNKEIGVFVRTSNFPQLCARSILHSIPEYADEYNSKERNTIRRAIIYNSRRSVYGPVKFLQELSPEIRAARQWAEVLLACPHELVEVTDEVELYGLVCGIHDAWIKSFFDDLMVASDESLGSIIASGTMIYMPVTRLIEYFRKSIDPKYTKRLAELVAVVSNRQRLAMAEGLATGTVRVPDYIKIFSPLSNEQIARLSKDHGIDPKVLYEWSALRVVLNSFSWLGKRVGEGTVPDSSIIFLALKRESEDFNNHELISECRLGIVALRATRIIDRWGPQWASKFDVVFSVTSVDNMEEFEKYRRGESLDSQDLGNAENF